MGELESTVTLHCTVLILVAQLAVLVMTNRLQLGGHGHGITKVGCTLLWPAAQYTDPDILVSRQPDDGIWAD